MIYQNLVEQDFFFDFVFYEVEKKTMYIYCPNCGSTHEVSVENSVKWMKKNHVPCSCFDFRSPAKYCHAGRGWENLNRSRTVAEFSRFGNEVYLNGYIVTARFGASNYNSDVQFDDSGNILLRHPIFDEEKVFSAKFLPNGKTEITSRLYKFMSSISIGDFRKKKKLKSLYGYELIEESFEQLKMTFAEKYVPKMKRFADAVEYEFNVPYDHNELTPIFLSYMIKNIAFEKLFDAGYTGLCVNRVLNDVCGWSYGYRQSYYINGSSRTPESDACVNWRGKTLERILRCNVQILDNLFERSDIKPKTIEAVKNLQKYGLAVNEKNLMIFHYITTLASYADKYCINLKRMVKYLRNQDGKGYKDLQYAGTEYVDYLKHLELCKVPMTEDVVFPTDLKAAHDRQIRIYHDMKDVMKEVGIKAVADKYGALNVTKDEYKLCVIPSMKVLQKYAKQLHNCSAGYADKIAREDSVLFTVIKKGVGLFMLELNMRDLYIVQNRGYKNESAPDDVIAFSNTWLEQIVKPNVGKLRAAG